MDSVKYEITWKTFTVPLIGLAAFFIYIYLFQVDIQQIIITVRQINVSVYLLATTLVILDTLFYTFAWHSLLRFLSVEISRVRSFLYVWIGIFIDTMIPAESVSGEISKIYLVNKEQNGAAGKATASVVAQRLIGMGLNMATLLVGAAFLLTENLLVGTLLTLTLFLISITLLFFVLILLLCVKENWTFRIVDTFIRLAERISRGRWRLTRLRSELVEATRAFHGAMKEYAHAPKTMFTAASFSTISWVFSLLVFYLTFLSIGYLQINWSVILVISAIFVAVKSVPIGIPFEVGLPEITLTTLLILFGVPPGVSATATILMRLLTLWLRFFIGFVAQQWIGIKAFKSSKGHQPSNIQS